MLQYMLLTNRKIEISLHNNYFDDKNTCLSNNTLFMMFVTIDLCKIM